MNLQDHNVYLIYGEEMKFPIRDGYIGISNNSEKRIKNHSTANSKVGNYIRNNPNYKTELLYSNIDEEIALDIEYELRRERNMGLNVAVGGGKPPINNRITSDETKEKLRKSNLGQKRSKNTKENMSKSQKNRFKNKPASITNSLTVNERASYYRWIKDNNKKSTIENAIYFRDNIYNECLDLLNKVFDGDLLISGNYNLWTKTNNKERSEDGAIYYRDNIYTKNNYRTKRIFNGNLKISRSFDSWVNRNNFERNDENAIYYRDNVYKPRKL